MKLAGMILVIAATMLLMSIEIILDAIPWSVLRVLGIVAGVVLFVMAVIAVICAMHSSMISRQEEAARQSHALEADPPDHNPRGNIWS